MKNKKREKKIHEFRKQYRIDLNNTRIKYGNWIPFGYNLDSLKGKY
jgi:hypothetical protein